MGSSERVFIGRTPHASRDHWPVPLPASLRVAGMVPSDAAGLDMAPAAAALDPVVEAREALAAAELEQALRDAAERGYGDGIARAEGEMSAAIAAVRALARSLETAIPRDVDMVSRTVAELAVLVTRRIIGAELRHEPAILVAAIENGLRHAVGASVIHVELHPDTVQAVEAAWTTRHGTSHRGFAWSFSADPTLEPGGCRLRSEHGVVEAGLEAQLSEIAAALDAAIPGYLQSALGPAGEPGPDEPQAAVTATEAVPHAVADFGAAAAITADTPAVEVAPVTGLVADDGTVIPFGEALAEFGEFDGALPGLPDAPDLAALAQGPALTPEQIAALLGGIEP